MDNLVTVVAAAEAAVSSTSSQIDRSKAYQVKSWPFICQLCSSVAGIASNREFSP
jgi:hypothetical protein